MPTAPAPITYAPPILWAAARALITTIFTLFGEPARIAAQHTRTARKQINRLRP